jgi:FkbM family methyltransferase
MTTATSRANLHCINRWEAAVLRREVKSYLSHGIQLRGGATVVDVGANIGSFSAYVHELLGGDVRVFAFEPLPPIFAVLERNVRERCGGRVVALPYGLSSREAEVEFTYFPTATVLSSSRRTHHILEVEEERIAGNIMQWARQGGGGPILKRIPASAVRRIVKLWLRRLQTEIADRDASRAGPPAVRCDR